jgi:hypothetical protein
MTMTVTPLPPLSERFGFVSALPSMVLLGWIGFLAGSGAVTDDPDVADLFQAVGKANIAQVTVVAIVAVAFGSVLHPFQIRFVRILEGYWANVPGLRHLQYLGIEINRRRMLRLYRNGRSRDMLQRYPPLTADLMPTAIGNALRSAERQAGKPYGMDAVLMLPWLYPLASPTVSTVFQDLRNQLDIAARYCLVFGLITVTGLVTLMTDGVWLLLPTLTAALTWASYRATLSTALAYGTGMHVLFDLHHADLLLALGWRIPQDLDEVKHLSNGLQQWLVNNGHAPKGYFGPAATAADKAGAETVGKGATL